MRASSGSIVPWETPGSLVLSTVAGAIFMLFLTGIAVLEISSGQPLIGLGTLCIVTMGICYMITRWKKQYMRPMAVLSSVLLLAMTLLMAAIIENPLARIVILLLAVAWSFFVILGIYNVFLKARNRSPGQS